MKSIKVYCLFLCFLYIFQALADESQPPKTNCYGIFKVTRDTTFFHREKIQASYYESDNPTLKYEPNSVLTGAGIAVEPNLVLTNLTALAQFINDQDPLKSFSLDGQAISADSSENKEVAIGIEKIVSMYINPDIALLKTNQELEHYIPLRDKPLEDTKMFVVGYREGDKSVLVLEKTGHLIQKGDKMIFSVNYSYIGYDFSGFALDEDGKLAGIFLGGIDNIGIFTTPDSLRTFLERKKDYICDKKSPQKCYVDAFRLFRKRIKSGRVSSMQAILDVNTFLGYEFGKNKYLKRLLDSSIETDPVLQYSLALYYSNLSGVTNQIKSMDLLERSAHQGFPPALFLLSDVYWHGKGGRVVDIHKAIRLLKESAHKGYLLATLKLYWIYRKGDKVPPNKDLSDFWLQQAKGHEFGHIPNTH